MIFPKNITGPRFDQGDLVTFIFNDAEINLRLPVIPKNRNSSDRVSSIKNFSDVNTSNWDTNDQERPCVELSSQRWCFEDERTLDNIAQCELYLGLVEVSDTHRKENTLLTSSNFEALMLAWHDYSFGERHNEKYAQDNSWPALLNRYHGRSISSNHTNWFIVQLSLSSETKPVNVAMIPINSRFVLMTFIEIESLHYAGRTNPFSNELLKQFERDLFDDFLSHIKIEYSAELISTIQSLKNKEPT